MKTPCLSRLLTALALYGACHGALAATPVDCVHLTPAALQNVVTQLNKSLAQANLDVARHGITGRYAVATKYNRDQVAAAQNQFTALQSWLSAHRLDTPYVSVTSGALNVFSGARQVIETLHGARNWATTSAVYHQSAPARQSIELTTNAINLLELMSAQATRCYVEQYGPFR